MLQTTSDTIKAKRREPDDAISTRIKPEKRLLNRHAPQIRSALSAWLTVRSSRVNFFIQKRSDEETLCVLCDKKEELRIIKIKREDCSSSKVGDSP